MSSNGLCNMHIDFLMARYWKNIEETKKEL